jgi:ketosteroid isomerase-like protein
MKLNTANTAVFGDPESMRRIPASVLFCLLALCPFASAQLPLDSLSKPAPQSNPFSNPGLTPGQSFLYGLEAKFAHDTAEGGGPAFAKWFAPDAVTLSNGKAPVIGQAAIAAAANWTTSQYQLTWAPEGARMSQDGDMGFTWGHYEGLAMDRDKTPIVTTGRYMTVWKKQPDGAWKVELDASNDEPPAKEDCCKLP